MSSANNSTSTPTSSLDPTTPLPPTTPPPPPPPPPPSTPPTPPATPPNTSAPTTSNGPDTTIVETVPPSGSTIVVTRTSTSTPSSGPGSAPPTDAPTTNGPTSQQPTGTSGADGGNRGMNGTARVVVAVVVPIIGVALIAIVLLFMWKRRQKTKADAEARRREVEEYGYNPNNDPHGGVAAVAGIGVARSSSNEETLYEMAESDATGYRGWGSTNGGRKALNMSSSVGASGPLSPVGMEFSDGGFPQQQENVMSPGPDGYTGIATSPSTSNFPTANSPSVDGSNAPLIHGNRPTTADSSVIGAMNGPVSADNSGGIHRGISNASSNYSAMTQSDQSDLGQPLSQHDAQYYGVDDGYEEAYYSSRNPAHPYPGDNGYGPAPVIRDVSARRNTRIETPTNTHFPQQGNSGIAQNF